MAIIKFTSGKINPRTVINYVCNKEKTINKLISGIDCIPESCEYEFVEVKKAFGKTDGRTYYHMMQSFSPDDLTGLDRFSPTVKPFLRITTLATLNLFPQQVAIWLTFSTFSRIIKYLDCYGLNLEPGVAHGLEINNIKNIEKHN